MSALHHLILKLSWSFTKCPSPRHRVVRSVLEYETSTQEVQKQKKVTITLVYMKYCYILNDRENFQDFYQWIVICGQLREIR